MNKKRNFLDNLYKYFKEDFPKYFVRTSGIISPIIAFLVISYLFLLLAVELTDTSINRKLADYVLNEEKIGKTIDKDEKATILELNKKGLIFSKKEIFDGVVAHYNTLITYLFSLIAIIVVFTVIYISWNSKQQLREEVEKLLDDKYFKFMLKEEVDKTKQELENHYSNIMSEYSGIIEKLEIDSEKEEVKKIDMSVNPENTGNIENHGNNKTPKQKT